MTKKLKEFLSSWVVVNVQSLSHIWLCDPMEHSTPGFPVLHYLSEFAQTHVHQLVMPSNHLIFSVVPFSCPQSFPVSGSFPMIWLFSSGGQSIGTSSVLPRNIQSWFPLGLTGLISLLSKGLSRIFSSTTVRKHQSLALRKTWWVDIFCCCYWRMW